MALFFERPGWHGAPGLHALIIGISAYPNLPAQENALLPAHFGMIQLASPALTVFRLAQALVAHADRLSVPLATCRVLLAPSAAELAVEPVLAQFGVPNFVNFSVEAKAWRTDAMSDPDGMTVFYFSGHGLQRVKRDHVLVLENFNDGIGGSLFSKGINVDKLIDGMAASAGQQNIARKQLYFFDTCRIQPDRFKETEIMAIGDFWDVNAVPAVDDRVQPSFFAAKPGGTAFAKAGGETLFGTALVSCLNGGAGIPLTAGDFEGEDWIVSLESLRFAMRKYIDEANANVGAAQELVAHNFDDDIELLRLAERPPVSVLLGIDPDAAAGIARVNVLDATSQPIGDALLFNNNPIQTILPAGVLRIRAVVEPEVATLLPKLDRFFVLQPPSVSFRLVLGR